MDVLDADQPIPMRIGWFQGQDSSMDVDPLGDLPVDTDDQDWSW